MFLLTSNSIYLMLFPSSHMVRLYNYKLIPLLFLPILFLWYNYLLDTSSFIPICETLPDGYFPEMNACNASFISTSLRLANLCLLFFFSLSYLYLFSHIKQKLSPPSTPLCSSSPHPPISEMGGGRQRSDKKDTKSNAATASSSRTLVRRNVDNIRKSNLVEGDGMEHVELCTSQEVEEEGQDDKMKGDRSEDTMAEVGVLSREVMVQRRMWWIIVFVWWGIFVGVVRLLSTSGTDCRYSSYHVFDVNSYATAEQWRIAYYSDFLSRLMLDEDAMNILTSTAYKPFCVAFITAGPVGGVDFYVQSVGSFIEGLSREEFASTRIVNVVSSNYTNPFIEKTETYRVPPSSLPRFVVLDLLHAVALDICSTASHSLPREIDEATLLGIPFEHIYITYVQLHIHCRLHTRIHNIHTHTHTYTLTQTHIT
eukprot:GHVQ01012610.1.p1 GENE.GHVQ01012610.1~~GHVQ01012610.1.p1  ORF type:complete len:425 (-),score=62.75 GHVQ01012610.1:21-1295(-)